tara:strand:+ start:1363 stop:2094 length:732 start_codon:yes stop_codon:yes gene_type:complete
MSLPKIAVKNYTITLPISKKRVTYRPFLVKEQKILLSAVEEIREEEDSNKIQSHLLKNFKNVVNNCIVSSKINLDDLSLVDFNFLFLQIRIASAGESVDVIYTCECETKKEIKINLDDIKVHFPSKEIEKKIQITNDVGIILDLPKVRISGELTGDSTSTDADKVIKVIASSIKQVYDSENVYDTNDQTIEEIFEFVESIPSEKLEEIQEYFNTVPYIEHKKTIDCPNGKEEMVVRNFEDFFR